MASAARAAPPRRCLPLGPRPRSSARGKPSLVRGVALVLSPAYLDNASLAPKSRRRLGWYRIVRSKEFLWLFGSFGIDR